MQCIVFLLVCADAGPWAPLGYLLEAPIAPYAALAMISFGGMFAVLTEWPGQVTQVSLHLGPGVAVFGKKDTRQCSLVSKYLALPANTVVLQCLTGAVGYSIVRIEQPPKQLSVAEFSALQLHADIVNVAYDDTACCRLPTTSQRDKLEYHTWPWVWQVSVAMKQASHFPVLLSSFLQSHITCRISPCPLCMVKPSGCVNQQH